MIGMPSINIVFTTQAAITSRRSGQGTVAIIVLDANEAVQGYKELLNKNDIPAALGEDNRAYIAQAFVGNVNRPARVLLYVLPADAANYADALAVLETKHFDWLVAPPEITAALAIEVAVWVRHQRDEQHRVYKAVLPHYAANDEAIVNFVTDDITINDVAFGAEGYCSRIAGLIAGTPLVQSATYVLLEEISDVERKTNTEMDAIVDAGGFLLFHDGMKVKTGRAVTSLVTVTPDKSGQLKKIKILEALDLINFDLRMLMQDNYIGKMENSYDNKCVLITAIQEYFRVLENEGILQAGQSRVGIDMDAQIEYLRGEGVDVSRLSDQQIREYKTGTHVFLAASVRVLDAIEDIDLTIDY